MGYSSEEGDPVRRIQFKKETNEVGIPRILNFDIFIGMKKFERDV